MSVPTPDTPSSSLRVRQCIVCGKKDKAEIRKCGKCRSVCYCSKECQKQHWPQHKVACAALAASKSSGTGSHKKAPHKASDIKKKLLNALEGHNWDDALAIVKTLPKEKLSWLDELSYFGMGVMCLVGLGGGPVELVEELSNRGVDINQRSEHYETPLYLAAMYSHVHLVKEFLRRGALVHGVDSKGASIFQKAGTMGSPEEKKEVQELLQKAAENQKNEFENRKEIANKLREQGNVLFRAKKFEEALDMYTAALREWDGDILSLSNRAATILALSNRDKIVSGTPEAWSAGSAVICDASKATNIDPTYLKAWHRIIHGQCLIGDFPRASYWAKEALKHHPQDAELLSTVDILKSRGVPEYFSNPANGISAQVQRRIAAGEASKKCNYCKRPVLASSPDACPHCACNPCGMGVPAEMLPWNRK